MPRRTPTPAEKAQRTAGWARTMTKWLITYTGRRGARWQVVNFTGPAGQESRGIVDLVAIRKDHRHEGRSLQRGDLFDIVLIQVKGGAARWPTADDVRRLRAVRAHHRARTIVLADWVKGYQPTFYTLRSARASGSGRSAWQKREPENVFG